MLVFIVVPHGVKSPWLRAVARKLSTSYKDVTVLGPVPPRLRHCLDWYGVPIVYQTPRPPPSTAFNKFKCWLFDIFTPPRGPFDACDVVLVLLDNSVVSNNAIKVAHAVGKKVWFVRVTD